MKNEELIKALRKEAALANDAADALEAAENQIPKHGEWITGKEIARELLGDRTIHIFYKDFKCSVCGLILDEFLFNIDGTPFYKFCPNCGAKMDGKEQNDETNDAVEVVHGEWEVGSD